MSRFFGLGSHFGADLFGVRNVGDFCEVGLREPIRR